MESPLRELVGVGVWVDVRIPSRGCSARMKKEEATRVEPLHVPVEVVGDDVRKGDALFTARLCRGYSVVDNARMAANKVLRYEKLRHGASISSDVNFDKIGV